MTREPASSITLSTTVVDSPVDQIVTVDPGDDFETLTARARKHDSSFDAQSENADEVGFHLYTSGTTGPPKAVAQSHRSWTNAALHTQKWLQYTVDDTLLNAFPVAHGNAQIHTVLTAVPGGAEIVIYDRFSASNWWDWCREYVVTEFNTMGSVLKMLYNQPPAPTDDENNVRVLFSAGAPPDLIEPFEERFGLRIVEGYSMTEAPSLAFNPVQPDRRRLESQGLMPAEKSVRIVDTDGTPKPTGEGGEIIVKGPDVMEGYHDAPEKTDEVMENGWFYTGDYGKLDADGFLYFLDRMDDVIRRSGENISSFEVENVIRELDRVTEVAVIPVPDDVRGQEVKALVIRQHESLSPEDIIEHCRANLADFKTPRYIEFVDTLPQTKTEKLQKSKLRENRQTTESAWDRYHDAS